MTVKRLARPPKPPTSGPLEIDSATPHAQNGDTLADAPELEPEKTLAKTSGRNNSNGSGVARSASGFGRSASILITFVLLSRLTGFLRLTVLAYFFGQNRLTDSYNYAFTIPDTLWQLIAGGALYAGFVPVISEYFAKEDEEGAWKTFSIVFTFLAVMLSIILPLAWIFAPQLLHILAPKLQVAGMPDVAHFTLPAHSGKLTIHPVELAVRLTRIVIPAQLCFFLGSLMMGCQHSKNRFLIPAVGPVIYNVGIIIGGIAGHLLPSVFGGSQNGYGIAGFAYGALAGAFIGSIVLQVWGLIGIRPRFRPSLWLGFPGVRKCGKLVLPVLLGVSLFQADTVINGYFVSQIPGGKSILDFSTRLMQLPVGIFGQAIGMVILPMLSHHAALKDTRQFKDILGFGTRLTLFLTVPASVLMILLAEPLIQVVYQHGNFTHHNTGAAVPALVYYAVGIPAWSAQAILARAFYALHNTRTPVIIGTSVTVVFVLLNVLLVNVLHMGVRGPALATSIAATIHCVLLFVLLWKTMKGMQKRPFVRSARRIIASAIIMGLVVYGIHHFLPSTFRTTLAGSILDLLLSGGVGLTVYVGIQLLLGSDEVHRFRSMMKNRKAKTVEVGG